MPGYEEPKQMVFCDFYPSSGSDDGGKRSDFETLREAVERLHLNDASFTFEVQHSEALGFGFRCGFLGLLHMDIVQERLEREGGVAIVQTAPTVTYLVDLNDGTTIEIHNPADLPDMSRVKAIREPLVKLEIICPVENIGDLMKLCRCPSRHLQRPAIPERDPADSRLRAPARGDHLRLLRQAEVDHPRLRHDGLRDHRLPRPTTS